MCETLKAVKLNLLPSKQKTGEDIPHLGEAGDFFKLKFMSEERTSGANILQINPNHDTSYGVNWEYCKKCFKPLENPHITFAPTPIDYYCSCSGTQEEAQEETLELLAGWICPGCKVVKSPYVEECRCLIEEDPST